MAWFRTLFKLSVRSLRIYIRQILLSLGMYNAQWVFSGTRMCLFLGLELHFSAMFSCQIHLAFIFQSYIFFIFPTKLNYFCDCLKFESMDRRLACSGYKIAKKKSINICAVMASSSFTSFCSPSLEDHRSETQGICKWSDNSILLQKGKTGYSVFFSSLSITLDLAW